MIWASCGGGGSGHENRSHLRHIFFFFVFCCSCRVISLSFLNFNMPPQRNVSSIDIIIFLVTGYEFTLRVALHTLQMVPEVIAHVSEGDSELKSIGAARAAFRDRDTERSRVEHQKKIDHNESHNTEASDYVKCVVFGGLDGIMTTFAIIAAAAGSSQAFSTILVFGFSNVVADAFSMGFGEYVSGSAEIDHAASERRREEWEVENAKDLEIEEMVEIYEHKGLSPEDARTVVTILAKDNKMFVDFMMVNELGIMIPDEDVNLPVKQGAVMFSAFITFGSVPLLAYLFAWSGRGLDGVFVASCLMTAVALMALGSIKGYLTGMNIPRSALLMLLNGVISGVVSFGISSMVEGMIAV